MAMNAIVFIKDVKPRKRNTSLRVRVANLWRKKMNGAENKTYRLDMILMDEMGDFIYANCMHTMLERFDSMLHLDETVYINNPFISKDNTKQHVDFDKKMSLNDKTTIIKCQNWEGPKFAFDFLSFKILNKKILKHNTKTDFIGYVKVCYNLDYVDKKNGMKAPKINFKLLLIKTTVELKSTEDKAVALSSFMSNPDRDPHVFLLVQFAAVNNHQGKMSVTNSYEGSRVFINEDIEELSAFKKRNFVDKESSDSSNSTVGSYMISNVEDQFLNNYRFIITPFVSTIRMETKEKKFLNAQARRKMIKGFFNPIPVNNAISLKLPPSYKLLHEQHHFPVGPVMIITDNDMYWPATVEEKSGSFHITTGWKKVVNDLGIKIWDFVVFKLIEHITLKVTLLKSVQTKDVSNKFPFWFIIPASKKMKKTTTFCFVFFLSFVVTRRKARSVCIISIDRTQDLNRDEVIEVSSDSSDDDDSVSEYSAPDQEVITKVTYKFRFPIPFARDCELENVDKLRVQACKLFGKPARYFVQQEEEMINNNEVPASYPKKFDEILGKKYAFLINVTPYNIYNPYSHYGLVMLTKEEGLVESICKKWNVEEVQGRFLVNGPADVEVADINEDVVAQHEVVNQQDTMSSTNAAASEMSTMNTNFDVDDFGNSKRPVEDVYQVDGPA
ncbi:hypothetical protein M8C21_026875, partial [Ambrosia artemisiifolia]